MKDMLRTSCEQKMLKLLQDNISMFSDLFFKSIEGYEQNYTLN